MAAVAAGDVVITKQNVVREVRTLAPDDTWLDEHGQSWWLSDITSVRTPHGGDASFEFGESVSRVEEAPGEFIRFVRGDGARPDGLNTCHMCGEGTRNPVKHHDCLCDECAVEAELEEEVEEAEAELEAAKDKLRDAQRARRASQATS